MDEILKCPKCGVELGKKEGNWVVYPNPGNPVCRCGYNYAAELMEHMLRLGSKPRRKKAA